MSGRLLDFSAYLGGPDNVQVIEMFPSTQKTFTYNFGTNVSNFEFTADRQTIVLDTVTYDRTTGEPNFTDTSVIGFFANAEISNVNIVTSQAASGIIKFTIPAGRYTGNIFPNARENVVMTVIGFTWTNTGVTPNTVDSHRWGIIERYEPDVPIGDPRQSPGYTSLVVE
jgi:hypothetical protein